MKRIRRDSCTNLFGPAILPVAVIEPGETVLFETDDASGGRIKTTEDALTVRVPHDLANPATGPVSVSGTEPGDTLSVTILDITLVGHGWGRIKSGSGVIIDELAPPAAFLVREEHGFLHFGETIRVKARPMVGVIGVAPLEPVHSFYPGPHGGNLDINEVRPGAVVHLPVRVEGALLALGDVHASMGDGELTGGGVDIPAEVTITTVVVKNQCLDFPLIETAEAWCACANAPGLQEAVRLATLRMTGLLASRLDMSREQAFILLGAAGDARIGQAAALDIDATAYVKVSKDILPTVF